MTCKAPLTYAVAKPNQPRRVGTCGQWLALCFTGKSTIHFYLGDYKYRVPVWYNKEKDTYIEAWQGGTFLGGSGTGTSGTFYFDYDPQAADGESVEVRVFSYNATNVRFKVDCFNDPCNYFEGAVEEPPSETSVPVRSWIEMITPVAVGYAVQAKFFVEYIDGTIYERAPIWSVGTNTITNGGIFQANVLGADVVTATYEELGVNLNATLDVSVVVAGARYGVATFANTEFTGGILELTAAELELIPDPEHTPSGANYTHWSGWEDFAANVMTQVVNITESAPVEITTLLNVDQYVYVMWPVGHTLSVKDSNGFDVLWTGINWRNDHLGNYEGMPEYDPNLPDVMQVELYGTTWNIIRSEASVLADGTYQNWTLQYV